MFFSCHKLFLCLYRSFSTCQSYISGSVPESVILPLYKNAFKVRLGQDIAVKIENCRILQDCIVAICGISGRYQNDKENKKKCVAVKSWTLQGLHLSCNQIQWYTMQMTFFWLCFTLVSSYSNTDSSAFSASQQIEGDIETNGHLALSEQARNSWVMQLPYNSRSCGSDYNEH